MKISGGLDNTWLMNVRGAVGGVLAPGITCICGCRAGTRPGCWSMTPNGSSGTRRTRRQKRMLPAGRCAPQAAALPVGRREPVGHRTGTGADRDTDTAKANLEAKVGFEAVSGDIGLNIPADKYINRVFLRVDALTYSVVELQAAMRAGPGRHWARQPF